MTHLSDNPERYPFNPALEISVIHCHEKFASGAEGFMLLDIRDESELEIACIEGARHIPMGELPSRLNDLEIEEDTVVAVLCRTGKRSLSAALYLQDQGFLGARSVAGGIHWWSDRLDPSLKKY